MAEADWEGSTRAGQAQVLAVMTGGNPFIAGVA
jgi:hypothetical protein